MSTRDLKTWKGELRAADLTRALHKVAVWAALMAERNAKLGQRQAGLRTRSGAMIQRTTAIARMAGPDAEVVLRVAVPYATTHEHGGTIRPVRGKYLAIPLGPAKTGAGVARSGPRAFPGLFFIKSKRGNLLLVKREGKTIVPYFVLVGGVRIPARPFARPAMDAVRKALPAQVAKAIRAAVRPGGA